MTAHTRATGLLWVAAPLWYLVTEAITASAYPGYSYATNYISDLGVPEAGVIKGRTLDSPLHAVMNGGFVGEGVLFLIGLALLLPHLKAGLATAALALLGLLHSAGITLVALVPGSAANAINGLGEWHGIGATAAILGGNLVAIVFAAASGARGLLRWSCVALGVFGLASAAILQLGIGPPVGISERGAVYTFIIWQLVTGLLLLRGRGLDEKKPG